MANIILDTSEMTSRDLKEKMNQLFGSTRISFPLYITLISFGYKYGIPLDADLVIDVRFLPNPYYIDCLRELTGLDPEVSTYVLSASETKGFLRRFGNLLQFLLPYYVREGKTHLAVAIGCTGGQHRSVVIVESLASFLKKDYDVRVHHRDLARIRAVGPA